MKLWAISALFGHLFSLTCLCQASHSWKFILEGKHQSGSSQWSFWYQILFIIPAPRLLGHRRWWCRFCFQRSHLLLIMLSSDVLFQVLVTAFSPYHFRLWTELCHTVFSHGVNIPQPSSSSNLVPIFVTVSPPIIQFECLPPGLWLIHSPSYSQLVLHFISFPKFTTISNCFTYYEFALLMFFSLL